MECIYESYLSEPFRPFKSLEPIFNFHNAKCVSNALKKIRLALLFSVARRVVWQVDDPTCGRSGMSTVWHVDAPVCMDEHVDVFAIAYVSLRARP